MCRTGVTCIFTFLHNSSEGMFLCLPEELYILSAFFVCHIHSEAYIHMYILVICFGLNLSSLLFHYVFLCSPSIYPLLFCHVFLSFVFNLILFFFRYIFLSFSFNLVPQFSFVMYFFCSPLFVTSSLLFSFILTSSL